MEEDTASSRSEVASSKDRIWLVVGLGNPGVEYEGTYHNVGFRVVERMAARSQVRMRQRCGPAMISDRIIVGKQEAILVQPLTFMNLSGQAFPKLFERFGSTIRDVVVVYDDLALPVGRIRLRQKGSSGGHNGIKSMVSSLGTDEFLRVRVGIQPDRPIADVRDFVLSRVSKSDRALLDEAEEVAADAVESLLACDIEKSMSAYNGIDLRK